MPYVLYIVHTFTIAEMNHEYVLGSRQYLGTLIRFDSIHSKFISFNSIALKMKLVKLIDYSSSLKIVNQAYHELLT